MALVLGSQHELSYMCRGNSLICRCAVSPVAGREGVDLLHFIFTAPEYQSTWGSSHQKLQKVVPSPVNHDQP